MVKSLQKKSKITKRTRKNNKTKKQMGGGIKFVTRGNKEAIVTEIDKILNMEDEYSISPIYDDKSPKLANDKAFFNEMVREINVEKKRAQPTKDKNENILIIIKEHLLPLKSPGRVNYKSLKKEFSDDILFGLYKTSPEYPENNKKKYNEKRRMNNMHSKKARQNHNTGFNIEQYMANKGLRRGNNIELGNMTMSKSGKN